MDRWAKGDPDGFIELSTDDVVYMDPFLEQKFEGIDQLKELYETIRGKVEIDRYEFIRPVVQAAGGCAVLTYNFISYYKEEMELHGSLPFGDFRQMENHSHTLVTSKALEIALY